MGGGGADQRVPEGFEEGVRRFDAGEWWEAHEAWEDPWRTAHGQERDFLQALILLAAALHKRWHHGSLTHRNFHKAEVYLDRLPAEYAGVDLARLRAEVWAALHDRARRPRVRSAPPRTRRAGGPPVRYAAGNIPAGRTAPEDNHRTGD